MTDNKHAEAVEAFQSRVQPWMLACFGAEIAADGVERNHRFLEEALELVQSTGCTASEAHQLVDYVFGRDVGEPAQEVGGVMVTLAALCLAHGLDMHADGETELARIWTKVEKIRAKQAAKPKHSPLPQHVAALNTRPDVKAMREACARVADNLASECILKAEDPKYADRRDLWLARSWGAAACINRIRSIPVPTSGEGGAS
ncbi:hypothetical protein [Sphingomonas sp. 1P08PE]|uniref:hypothetical protein n=1 Tax=Sphingomonas sp. 1P08PE TaxID=554122 RepID=UPI0039A2CCD8